MGTTPGGLPYMDDTDPLSTVAAKMKALAEATEGGFVASKAGGFTVPNATFTDVAGLTVSKEIGECVDGTTGLFTAPVAGSWLFTGSTVFRSADTGGTHRLLVLERKVSGVWMEQVRGSAPITGGQNGASFSAMLGCSLGDQFRWRVYQDSGSTMTFPSPGAGTLPNTTLGARLLFRA